MIEHNKECAIKKYGSCDHVDVAVVVVDINATQVSICFHIFLG